MKLAAHKRQTRQKNAIRKAFLQEGRPLSAEEVQAAAKQYLGRLGLATVYRNIHALVAEHWLDRVEIPGLSARYEVAGKPHHDHFQCCVCSKVFDIDGCCVPERIPVPEGFTCAGHEYFAFGVCPLCPMDCTNRYLPLV